MRSRIRRFRVPLRSPTQLDLAPLETIWLVPPEERARDSAAVCEPDEAFRQMPVGAAGNPEMARIHRDPSDPCRRCTCGMLALGRD